MQQSLFITSSIDHDVVTYSPWTYNQQKYDTISSYWEGHVVDVKKICTAFGLKVQALRQSKSWSQEKLALESCLDRTYISSLERGKRNVSLINIFKIANALNIPASNLLQLDGDNNERD